MSFLENLEFFGHVTQINEIRGVKPPVLGDVIRGVLLPGVISSRFRNYELKLEPDASEVSRHLAGRQMCSIAELLSRALELYATLVSIPSSEANRTLALTRDGQKEQEWKIINGSIRAPVERDFIHSGESPRTLIINGSTLRKMREMANIGGESVACVAQQSLALYRRAILAGPGSTLHIEGVQNLSVSNIR